VSNFKTKPATTAVSMTAGTTYSPAFRGFLIDADGPVVLTTADGDSVTLPALKAGAIYAIEIVSWTASGTTATEVWGLR